MDHSLTLYTENSSFVWPVAESGNESALARCEISAQSIATRTNFTMGVWM